MEPEKNGTRNYWLWVTRPTYYLEKDGSDRQCLDPGSKTDTSGWWTCHRNTRKGDLALLWRTAPKRDIGYLIQARSNSYSLYDDDYAFERGWEYGCDYQPLWKFGNPVLLSDLRDSPYLQDWGALRARFQGRVFRIPPQQWKRLTALLSARNPTYSAFLEKVEQVAIHDSIVLEEQIEEALAADLGALRKFDFDLELYKDERTGIEGRQVTCTGNGGRIDLLCRDRKDGRFVVIELKNVRAGQDTFGQIANYVGWVQDRIAGRTPVVGLVLSRGCDPKFLSALKTTDRILQLDLEALGF